MSSGVYCGVIIQNAQTPKVKLEVALWAVNGDPAAESRGESRKYLSIVQEFMKMVMNEEADGRFWPSS